MVTSSRCKSPRWLNCVSTLARFECVTSSVLRQMVHAWFASKDFGFIIRISTLTYFSAVGPIVELDDDGILDMWLEV